MRTIPFLAVAALGLVACKNDDVALSTGDSGTTPSATPGAFDCGDLEGTDLCSSWIRNTTGETAVNLVNQDGSGVVVNIRGLQLVDSGGDRVLEVDTSGIPSYAYTLTDEDVAALNARPNAATDFVEGAPTVVAGQVVQFGDDVGYNGQSPAGACGDGEGFGFWPPGPECPYDVGTLLQIPADPEPADQACETGLGITGLWLSGVSIFNWGDGFAYDDAGTWLNIAGAQEVYDLDICAGHAAAGEYHHHSYSTCLAAELGDAGDGHSPIYGYAADGYPIHGPWQSSGQEALSCWTQRDYDDPSDPTGCGGTGERSCQMVDPLDPSQGTVDVTSHGPRTTDTVVSLSGNSFPGTDGLYYQDFWYDASCTDAGGAALDEHNGHEHDDLGYHYHVTFAFPFTMGPTLRGEVLDNNVKCTGVSAGGPGGGGGPM